MTANLPAATDSDLLHRYARQGDQAAFAELVHRHQAMVLGVATRRTGSNEMVIRAMLEACAQACRLCKEECQRHARMEHCRVCADACQRCEDACQGALATVGSGLH